MMAMAMAMAALVPVLLRVVAVALLVVLVVVRSNEWWLCNQCSKPHNHRTHAKGLPRWNYHTLSKGITSAGTTALFYARPRALLYPACII